MHCFKKTHVTSLRKSVTNNNHSYHGARLHHVSLDSDIASALVVAIIARQFFLITCFDIVQSTRDALRNQVLKQADSFNSSMEWDVSLVCLLLTTSWWDNATLAI